jgi:hypothetical protein
VVGREYPAVNEGRRQGFQESKGIFSHVLVSIVNHVSRDTTDQRT